MESLHADEMLDIVRRHVSSHVEDTLALVVAVAEPDKVKIGVSVQNNYPLGGIHRTKGIPFGNFRNDPFQFVSEPNLLHGLKWNIETHELVFRIDTVTDEFIRTRQLPQGAQVGILLSTGIGNILQNLGTVAYKDRTLHMVEGESLALPYTYLVKYSPSSQKSQFPIAVEILRFDHARGCRKIDKKQYLSDRTAAVHAAKAGIENEIQWAVSGYPILLEGEEVPLEMIAESVTDYRHLWSLPKLQKSVVNHFALLSDLLRIKERTETDEEKGERIEKIKRMIEFYLGFNELREDRFKVDAAKGKAITLPLALALPLEVTQTICSVCHIDQGKLRGSPLYENSRLNLDPKEVSEDFTNGGYKSRPAINQVNSPGDFYIDGDRKEITIQLLPGIYPHHIVGIDKSGRVINISIAGLSGRSGIIIEDAKKLCKRINITDAIILDNGFDVFVRMLNGAIICHSNNTRQRAQTNVTAALIFGYLLEPQALLGGNFEGFEIAYTPHKTLPKSLSSTEETESEVKSPTLPPTLNMDKSTFLAEQDVGSVPSF